jgi:glutamyl-tRNA synthetase
MASTSIAVQSRDDTWDDVMDDVMRLVKSKGSMDVDLKGAVDGEVVTRFPPEPSGFLHIGHAKAALLNDFFARKWHGRLILRFDDTNTDKSTQGFETSILADLERLGIKPDSTEYTSDFFPKLLEIAETFIREDKAYVDATPQEEMRTQRKAREANEYRSAPVEENLRLWAEMLAGTEFGKTCCLRAKIDMRHKNGALRDPIMYRGKEALHHRTGDSYKVYPTYDFSCPLVDSMEGVTHALRSLEYKDREKQYQWFCEAAGMRCPDVWEFSRLDFQRTLLSKRKLQRMIDIGAATSWDDPRFPTIQGVRRRGMTIQGLRAFILSQGASRNITVQGWDKIWAVNKRVIDPIAPRYVALDIANAARITIKGAPEEIRALPRHKKNADVGLKNVIFSGACWIEGPDAAALKVGEIVTLMDLGNAEVTAIEDNGKNVSVTYLPDDDDFKKTVKITWLADVPDLVPIKVQKFSDLLTKDKLDEEDDFELFVNRDSIETEMLSADVNVRMLQKGDIIQLERRGYYICDSVYVRDGNTSLPLTLFEIPDGRVVRDLEAERAEKEAKIQAKMEKMKAKKARTLKPQAPNAKVTIAADPDATTTEVFDAAVNSDAPDTVDPPDSNEKSGVVRTE